MIKKLLAQQILRKLWNRIIILICIKTTFNEKDDKLLFKPFELSKKFQGNPILD